MNEFKIYFLSEGWTLFQTYIASLQTAMERNNVTSTKQIEVVAGLLDFVDEYFEEQNASRLNYITTLNLLKDLGSPSEVLFAMDLFAKQTSNSMAKDSPPLTMNCKKCNELIPLNSNFCEICGTSTDGVKDVRSVVSQRIIDHPYSSVFLCSYFIFVLIGGVYWILLNLSNLSNPVFLRILPSFLFSPVVIIGTLISALVFGYILNFFLEDLKSETVKINKLLNSLEDNFAIALFLVILAVLLFDFLIAGIISISTNTSSLTFFVLFLVISGIFLIIIGIWNYAARPVDPDLFSLLKIKKLMSSKIRNRIIFLNMITSIFFLLLVIFIPFFITQYMTDELTPHAPYIGFLMGLVIFLLGNGIYTMYFYSWPYLKRVYPKRSQVVG